MKVLAKFFPRLFFFFIFLSFKSILPAQTKFDTLIFPLSDREIYYHVLELKNGKKAISRKIYLKVKGSDEIVLLSNEHFSNGKPKGKFTLYHPNGIIKTVGFTKRSGMETKPSFYFDESGILFEKRKSNHKETITKVCRYHPNGIVSEKGKIKHWYKDGHDYGITNSEKTGNWIYFDEAGKKIKTEKWP